MKLIYLVMTIFLLSGCGASKTIIEKNCSPPDNRKYIFGEKECFRIKTYNSIKNPKALVVLVHGDGSSGRASDYLAKRAHRINPELNQLTVVALIRPGYFDSEGNYSTGSDNNRRDHYTAYNVDEIASAVKNLKKEYKPSKVVIAGHSGGAAIAGNIIGRHPNLVDGVVLAACPCDVPRWRATRTSAWPSSLSPASYVGDIKNTKVVAIAGSSDGNTFPGLMSDYVDSLRKNNIDASFFLLEGVSHNGTASSEKFFSEIINMTK